MSTSFDHYRAEIAAEYATAKHGANANFLLKPSPARLRDLCLILYDEGLQSSDVEILTHFFSNAKNSDLRGAIRHFDTDKLRPIQRFFLGQTELSPMESVNLAALLVNFEPRPFLKYKNKQLPIAGSKPKSPESRPADESELPPQRKNRTIAIVIGLCIFGLLLTGIKLVLLEKKECMKWEKDHFVAVNCNIERPSWEQIEAIDPQRLKNFRKIAVCDTTTFFKNRHPIIWYDKSGEEYEFFTAPGLDPVDGHTVRPITSYIILHHVQSCR